MTALPAKLKLAGYFTHMVGKWHLGYFKREYLPVNRGIGTSSGFLNGAEDHTDERLGVDFWKNDSFDSHNGTYDAYLYRDDLTTIFSFK